MKTRSLWLSLCLAVTVVHSASGRIDEPTGIKFFTGSWKDVLAEAKRQNKPVFVDIYTTWCGPCKLMAKQAFPDAKVGEKFNASFVSYQIDAEKGEGIELAKKYAVTAYPTSLYVSANGELIHRAIGYGGIKGMLDEADKAIEAAKDANPLSALETQYEGGKRDAEFMRSYLTKRAKVGMPNGEALNGYLKSIPESDWTTDDNLNLMTGNLASAQSKAFEVLLQQYPRMMLNADYRELSRKVPGALNMAIQNDFRRAVDTKDEALLDGVLAHNAQLQSLYRKQTKEILDATANQYRMRFYQQTKNANKYRTLAMAEADRLMAISADSLKAKDEVMYKRFQEQTARMPDSIRNRSEFKKYAETMKKPETGQVAMKLNNLAWAYYETMTDPKDLNQALTWSAKSLEHNRTGMYLDTYAHLLNKLGRKADAIKAQEEAITLTKLAGDDAAGYEKSLAEMKAKK